MIQKAHSSHSSSLWRWVSIRVVALAIGTAVLIGFCMWLRFAIWNDIVLRRMPEATRIELKHLVADPHRDTLRLLQVIDEYYGVEYVYPEIGNGDWLMLFTLLMIAAPLITGLGWWISRPVSQQFSHLAYAAKQVAGGDFCTRAVVITRAPKELRGLTLDFNEMTAKLELYEREIRDSSAILAHELRTPLNAAMGRLQGIIDGVFPPDVAQLQMIMHRLGLLNRLVDDLHLLSLASAGQLAVEKSLFLVDELVSERLSWVGPRIESNAIQVTRQISVALKVTADRDRLGQVFSILIDNTLRYATDGGSLEIGASICEGWMTIDFADRGSGIAPEHRARVFDRFWRAEHSRARHSGGSGLGLSIASAICVEHGGLINVIDRDGGGAIVRIKLPVA